jgi:unsaturated chondroitin disaccharide hydrolase
MNLIMASTNRIDEVLEIAEAGSLPVCRMILASPETHYPQLDTRTGRYRMEEGYLPGRGFRWAGFLAGRLWLLFDLTGNLLIRDAAHRLSLRIRNGLNESRPMDRGNCGFDGYYALCAGAVITGDGELRKGALESADVIQDLYIEKAKLYIQNSWLDAIVSETPACLLPILWAHSQGERNAEPVREHVHIMLKGGMLREDGSCQHRLFFNRENGEIARADTSQGFSETSTWARAQAWLMHSLLCCLETFGDDGAIRTALEKASMWYVAHLPEDGLLYYDFNDPRLSEIPRDSCGTLIGLVALRRCLALGLLDDRARQAADRSEIAILDRCVGPGGVVLHGSWGVGEGKSRWNTLFPQQDVMPYGNYWLLEMLHRQLKPDSRVFSFTHKGERRAAK